jgi:hypothetical protein
VKKVYSWKKCLKNTIYIFLKVLDSEIEPFKASATPRTVMVFSIFISTGAHSSTVAFVLHRTKDWQRRNEKIRTRLPRGGESLFSVIFHLSIGKAAMNALRLLELS